MTDKQVRDSLNDAIQMLEDLSDVAELRGSAYIYKTKTPKIRIMIEGLKELACSVDLEEIESIRSDNDRLTKEVEYQVKRNDEYRESEISLLDKLQQVERERDIAQLGKGVRNELWARNTTLTEANTAMREAIEEIEFQLTIIEYDTSPLHEYVHAFLSRYPKEGDTPCETDTAKK
jgi:hypothetical protein